nr:solute carrier organic anion transporter family member 4A1-like [Dermacentor andersoni]
MSSLPTAKFAADVGQSSSSLSTQGHYQDVCVPPADVAPPPEPARKISLTQLPYIKHARERDERCGWCWFRPDFLLKLRHPRYVLLALCCMVFLQGFVANGLVYMVLPTLERRFELKSLEAGTIVAMYHLASCISAPLVTLVAARRSKPLYLAMSAVVIGIGTMVIVLPHFMAPHYMEEKHERLSLCPSKGIESSLCGTPDGDLRRFRFIFWVGHFIVGAGSSPMYTLALIYLDENVPTTLSTKYIATYQATSLLGTASGFVLSGYMLNIYTEVSYDPSRLGLTPQSNVWIGAWWLGYLIGSISSIIVAFPTSLLPKELPSQIWAKLEKKCGAAGKKGKKPKESFGGFKDIPAHVNALLHNATYMFLCLAGTAETMIMTGLATFMTKLFESQLGISSSSIAPILGSVAVPGACGGILLGGYCVHKLNLDIDGIVRMCLMCSVVPWLSSFVLLYSCPAPTFFGMNHTSSRFYVSNVSNQFDQLCNANCNCPIENYDPVCGKDLLTYYSPCFAGCKRDYIYENVKVYTDCQCISHPGVETMVQWGLPQKVQADRKKCVRECNALFVYMSGIFLYIFFTFLLYTPGVSATIRCVEEHLKALSLGFQWMMVTLLGAIPAAALFGFVIDNSCVLWNTVCEQLGACAVHDNEVMSRNLFTAVIVLKTLSMLFFVNALIFLRGSGTERGSHDGTPECESSSNASAPVMQSAHKLARLIQGRASSGSLY